MRLSDLGELGFLAELERRGLARAIEHDAAQVDGLVVTQDALVEGVHFRRDWISIRDLGFRAAAVNLSDLAASGAEPSGFVVSLGAPPDTEVDDLLELYEGIAETGVPVVGGDTTRADILVLSVTALGRSQRVPGRAGAEPGDLLVVTGPLGAAGAAFRDRRYVRPPIRLDEGRRLAQRAHAMLDISDGIARDAGHIARRSQVRCVVELDRIPLAGARRSTTSASERTSSSSLPSPSPSSTSLAAARKAMASSSCARASRTHSPVGITSKPPSAQRRTVLTVPRGPVPPASSGVDGRDVPSVTVVTFIIFFVIPSEDDQASLGRGGAEVDVRTTVQIDGPIYEEYFEFLRKIVTQGSLGNSWVLRGQEVNELLVRAAPVTLSLVIGGALLWMLIAIPTGLLSALHPRSLGSRLTTVLVLIGISAHPLWMGLMLSYLVGAQLGWTPTGGYCEVFSPATNCGGPAQWAYHLIFWFTFALMYAAIYTRMIRASTLETLNKDYVRTARAKGHRSGR